MLDLIVNKMEFCMNTPCFRPKYSSYSFVKCLFAALVETGKVLIDLPSVVRLVYEFKQKHPEYKYMFDDIEFRRGTDYIVSDDIIEGISRLQTYNAVGKLNPKYERLVIFITEERAKSILDECELDDRKAYIELAQSFQGNIVNA
ncbi:MAG: hypothetical protein IKN14_08520 [Clostridiales bacterium]|nr:hypothetical protein [Clostridiales bacterium]